MSEVVLKKITLAGFRAYLDSRSFDLLRGGTPLSLALFAENARGKSSLVDGLEFYISEKGGLSRLGQQQTTSQGGTAALEHVEAKSRGIEPSVTVSYLLDGMAFDDKRTIGGDAPVGAQTLRKLIPVNPIIRGYQLRRFVEDHTEADRYAEVASWLGLQPLVDLQDKLAKLKRDYKKAAEDSRPAELATRGLPDLTDRAVARWDEAKVLAWLNTALVSPLKEAITFTDLSKADKGYFKLVELKQAEDARLGLPKLRTLKGTFEDIAGKHAEEGAVGVARIGGKARAAEDALIRFSAAKKVVQEMFAASSQALLSPVWQEAVTALERPDYLEESCPVCETSFSQTDAGSRTKIVSRLQGKLATLEAFNKASAERTQAQLTLSTAGTSLSTALLVLKTHLEAVDRKLPEGVPEQPLQPPFTTDQIENIRLACERAADALESEIAEQEAARGSGSCKECLEKVEKVLDMATAYRHAVAEMSSRKEILNAVITSAKELNEEIQAHVSNVLSELRGDVDALYKQITHAIGRPVPDINLTLPEGGKSDRLCLTIDFAPNRKKVAPSGYLSDAQLHSLGLALRLAAIKRYNVHAHFIVLDDIVTSYDRDHRQKIANLLADEFSSFQVIVVTHERQFFEYLREKLPQKTWQIKRIRELNPDSGPEFEDDRPSDEEIDGLLRADKSAENEIRKAQEHWLQQICHEFGVLVKMPTPTQLPKFGRAELAIALEDFVKTKKININTSYFSQLKMGTAENSGSHGSSDASAGPSAGDMNTRWNEFKLFRDQFVCACGGKRFTRAFDANFPKCKKPSCELPFKGAPGASTTV